MEGLPYRAPVVAKKAYVSRQTVKRITRAPQNIVHLHDEYCESNKFAFAVSANLNLGVLRILARNPSLFQPGQLFLCNHFHPASYL